MQTHRVQKVHCLRGLNYNIKCVPLVGHSIGVLIFRKISLSTIDFLEVNQ